MKSTIVPLALFITLSGCGHFLMPQDYSIHPYQEISAIQSDTATIVFLWPDRRYGTSTLAVQENGTIIGALQGGTYFSHAVTPGSYIFSVDSGLIESSREQVSLTAKQGHAYFLEYSSGGLYVVSKLNLISEDVARAQLPQLSMIQLIRQ